MLVHNQMVGKTIKQGLETGGAVTFNTVNRVSQRDGWHMHRSLKAFKEEAGLISSGKS